MELYNTIQCLILIFKRRYIFYKNHNISIKVTHKTKCGTVKKNDMKLNFRQILIDTEL